MSTSSRNLLATPSRSAIQPLLPTGLVLGQQHAVPASQGLVFDCLDRRLGSGEGLLRTIRVLRIHPEATWTNDWLEALQNLANLNLSGVCRPLEIGRLNAGDIYVLFERFPAVLAEQIPATGLIDRRLIRMILNQVVEALAELHRSHGPHGDLRSAVIYLSTPTLTKSSQISIGMAELSGVPFWTDGELMDPQAREIFPPEWNHRLCAASRSSDVYAIGLLALELVAGQAARINFSTSGEHEPRDLHATLGNRLNWFDRQFLIEPLLADVERRPADASAVRRRWQTAHRRRFQFILVGTIVLAGALLLMMHHRYRSQITLIQERMANVEKSEQAALVRAESAERQLQSLQNRPAPTEVRLGIPTETEAKSLWTQRISSRSGTERNALIKSLTASLSAEAKDRLETWSLNVRQAEEASRALTQGQQPGPLKSPRRSAALAVFKSAPWDIQKQEDVPRAFWEDLIAAEDTLDAKRESTQRAFEEIPRSNWLRDRLDSYRNVVAQRQGQWSIWERQDETLLLPWRTLLETPWDPFALTDADRHLKALVFAQDAWCKVASRNNLTWEQFKEQLFTRADANPLAKRIASTWVDQLNQYAAPDAKAAFTISAGTSPAGSGTYRSVDIYVARSQFAMDDEVTGFDWTSETNDATPRNIAFPWKPGQAIQVLVYGERQTWRAGLRPAYINYYESGPIALWRLAHASPLSNGKHTLTIRVLNCPGPPLLPEAQMLPGAK
eukprot:TRINITY_DN758_c1_g2_i5.p2 TRINITY_DN758_c1_g2~~TRINITY_DN758_c1_g2_i5.p2  ORF type:complete len:730 (+),score=94.51 TRINITY_DN758_c1_g2_i5:7492-9681(+)